MRQLPPLWRALDGEISKKRDFISSSIDNSRLYDSTMGSSGTPFSSQVSLNVSIVLTAVAVNVDVDDDDDDELDDGEGEVYGNGVVLVRFMFNPFNGDDDEDEEFRSRLSICELAVRLLARSRSSCS